MLRLLLWILIIYVAIKVIRILLRVGTRPPAQSHRTASPPFDDVEEAKFEDITPKHDETDSPDSKEPT
jgi:hypothetical protein